MINTVFAEGNHWYGEIHPYFCRQNNKVVRAHIKAFTKEGDTVMDPFVGSGTTALEALFLNRNVIASDSSNLAVFVTSCLTENLCIETFSDICKKIISGFNVKANLQGNYDRDTLLLFGIERLKQYEELKHAIDGVDDTKTRKYLYLSLSRALERCNNFQSNIPTFEKTFGTSSLFNENIVTYRDNPDNDLFGKFAYSTKIIIAIKSKTNRLIKAPYRVVQSQISSLNELDNVDYIITDPPFNLYYSTDIFDKLIPYEDFIKTISGNTSANPFLDLFDLASRCLKDGSYMTITFCALDKQSFHVFYPKIMGMGINYQKCIFQPKNVSLQSIRNFTIKELSWTLYLVFRKGGENRLGKATYAKEPHKLIPFLFEKGELEKNYHRKYSEVI